MIESEVPSHTHVQQDGCAGGGQQSIMSLLTASRVEFYLGGQSCGEDVLQMKVPKLLLPDALLGVVLKCHNQSNLVRLVGHRYSKMCRLGAVCKSEKPSSNG